MPRLTARGIAAIKEAGLHGDGGGLFLHVSKRGAKSWILRYQLDGNRRDMGLGGVDLVSLAEARAAALEARRLARGGNDPIEARRRAVAARRGAAVTTFRTAAEAFIESQEAGWKNAKHKAQWPATLAAYAYPVFGDRPIAEVDADLVMQVLEPIWREKPETASRLRGRIERVIDWAKARGRYQGENPARWRGHLASLLPPRAKVRRVEHHAALPYSELPAFLADLRQQDGIAAGALEFAILTAARTGEVIGARWEEVTERLWVIPGERMKAGREHRVPLSDAALAIIERMADIRQGEFVFPGQRLGKPLSNMALLMTLRRMGRADLTAHGFRSTFSDWCAERTNFPAEVREMALAHAVGDKVEAAYRRGDLFEKRRQLADAWARYCTSPIAEGASVVPIRR